MQLYEVANKYEVNIMIPITSLHHYIKHQVTTNQGCHRQPPRQLLMTKKQLSYSTTQLLC